MTVLEKEKTPALLKGRSRKGHKKGKPEREN